MISSFSGKHEFLSNFSPCSVWMEGVEYSSVEHAYQAAKTTDKTWREKIRLEPSPAKAKRIGRKVPLRPDWDVHRLAVMEALLWQKFLIEPFRTLLLGTGTETLVEGNTWGDRFWGVCGEGENHLGRILMKIRQALSPLHPPDYTMFEGFAIGDIMSRIVWRFSAVVSILTTEARTDRPWSAELTSHSPQLPPWVPCLVVDLADGEARNKKPVRREDSEGYLWGEGEEFLGHRLDRDFSEILPSLWRFVDPYVVRGPVLFHCGQGRSRSVTAGAAYLCHRDGIRPDQAFFQIQSRRITDPARCFVESLEDWYDRRDV